MKHKILGALVGATIGGVITTIIGKTLIEIGTAALTGAAVIAVGGLLMKQLPKKWAA